MTDKQIIINGVDVLKEKINMCFILLSHKLETSETIEQTIYDHLDVFVEEWNNQLKRKEQECEAYQKQFKADTKEMEDYQNTIVRHLESIEYWVQQFKAKEQECEELKGIRDRNFLHALEEQKRADKLSKTLTEIKEIAEVLITTTDEYDNCYYKNRCSKCEVKEDCQYIKVEQILQKISEVEDD